MPSEQQIFANRLNYYMDKNGKSQTDLINDLGINKSTISTWCNGTKMPRMGTIQTLADYFGIMKSDLIEEKPADTQADGLNMFMLDDRKKVLMGKVLHLNDENRAKMEGYIDSLLADQQKQ